MDKKRGFLILIGISQELLIRSQPIEFQLTVTLEVVRDVAVTPDVLVFLFLLNVA